MSIVKRGNQLWVKFQLAGKETYRSAKTTDRRQAEKFESYLRNQQHDTALLGDRGANPFAQAAARYLKETTRKGKVNKDSYIVDWFLAQPLIAEAPLRSFDDEVFENLRATLEEGERAPKTVNRMMSVLRSILNRARKKWGWLATVPHVSMSNAKGKTRRALTHEEYAALRRELPEHLKPCADFAVLTGMRMTPMLRLTWDHVDMKAGTLYVVGEEQKNEDALGLPIRREVRRVLMQCRTAHPHGEHVFQYTDLKAQAISHECIRSTIRDLKAAGGRIPYRRLFAELLTRYGVRGKTETVMSIWRRECGTTRRGTVHHKTTWKAKAAAARPAGLDRPIKDCNTEAYKAAVVRAGLNPAEVNWHTLRHTFATWARKSGVTREDLKKLGAWRDDRMVENYDHFDTADLEEAADKVGAFFLTGKRAAKGGRR